MRWKARRRPMPACWRRCWWRRWRGAAGDTGPSISFWPCSAFLSLSWCLNVPGYVDLLRLPGLNMMSHNRLVFLASFAILAMMAVGLEVFLQGPVQWRWWFWLPAALLAGLCVWCGYRAIIPPEPIATKLAAWLSRTDTKSSGFTTWTGCGGFNPGLPATTPSPPCYAAWAFRAGCFCGARRAWQVGSSPCWERCWWQTCSGSLTAAAPNATRRSTSRPSRPWSTLPNPPLAGSSAPIVCRLSLASIRGLRDIRGYDGVDPARLVDLTALAADPQSKAYPYALMQWLTPKARLSSQGELRLSPVFDMLGVRYLIGRGSPPPDSHPAFQGTDYWVIVNSNALPRTFIPRRVETVAEDKARLAKLASPEFDPREVAYVESPVNLPGPCRGTAEIVEEIPDAHHRVGAHGNAGAGGAGRPLGQGLAGVLERPARAHSPRPTMRFAAWSSRRAPGRWSSATRPPALPGG